jgi:hypothetical protein
MTITTLQKIGAKNRAIVFQALQEIMRDPDFGLEISSATRKQLKQAVKSKKRISLTEIKRKYL